MRKKLSNASNGGNYIETVWGRVARETYDAGKSISA
ncbi:DNA-binding response OmpR family regulator [Rhodoblastus sphagnicola]|nr:DNA-binding response OmpR family regulator [Rhodoblastus sphagnicola]